MWECQTPALVPDGEGGTLLLEESAGRCDCGGSYVSRMTFVHEGTKAKNLVSLGNGASVKHLFTDCSGCGCSVS